MSPFKRQLLWSLNKSLQVTSVVDVQKHNVCSDATSRTFWRWPQTTRCWLDSDLAGMPSRSGRAQAQLPTRLALLPQHRGSNTPRTARWQLPSSDKSHTQLPSNPDCLDKQPGSPPTDKTALYSCSTWNVDCPRNVLLLTQTQPAVPRWTRARPSAGEQWASRALRLLYLQLVTLVFPTKAYSFTYTLWHGKFTPGPDA